MKIRLFTIPNLLTLSNLLCGSLAAVAALRYDNLVAAFWLIVLAAVFDFFDGFVARLLHQSGPLGVQLDSLADDVTFGFAPAAVLFSLYGCSQSLWLPEETGYGLIVFFFVACAALRLAKFNIDDTQRTEFCGLPSPAAALFCASLGLLASYGQEVSGGGLDLPREVILAVAIGMGLLMVSPIRMFALKFHGFGWRGNEIRYGFILASIVLIVLLQAASVPAIILLYVLVSLIRWLGQRSAVDAEEA